MTTSSRARDAVAAWIAETYGDIFTAAACQSATDALLGTLFQKGFVIAPCKKARRDNVTPMIGMSHTARLLR